MCTTDANYSVFVSGVLDIMGYSYDMLRQRRLMNTIDIGDANMFGDDTILAGSTGEGTTSWFESDLDFMDVYAGDLICTDNVLKAHTETPDQVLFELNLQDASPGYALLRLASSLESDDDLQDFLEEDKNGECYLQSTNFRRYGKHMMQEEQVEGLTVLPDVGPSIPGLIYSLPYDFVFALKCDCSTFLKRFLARPRKYSWPSQKTLDKIAKLESHLVPVGNKSGINPDMEWRICYTKAELCLMEHLNETQIKLYILMKLLAKSVFPDSNAITSYILKNLVLWMSELFPTEQFTKALLVERLVHALKILKQCVQRRYLPNYMIPERNLFSGLKRPEQVGALKQLTQMINDGGNSLFLCPKLKEAMLLMYQSPAKAYRIGNLRDMLEQYFNYLCGNEGDDKDELGVVFEQLCIQECGADMAVVDPAINGDLEECRIVNMLKRLHQLFL